MYIIKRTCIKSMGIFKVTKVTCHQLDIYYLTYTKTKLVFVDRYQYVKNFNPLPPG